MIGAVKGVVTLTQESENAPTTISGSISGLTPGDHGFHVQYDRTTENVHTSYLFITYLAVLTV